jgi:hypothetical protein
MGVLKMRKTYFAAGRTWVTINGNAGKNRIFRGRRFSSVGALSNTEGMKEVAEEDSGGKGQGSQ